MVSRRGRVYCNSCDRAGRVGDSDRIAGMDDVWVRVPFHPVYSGLLPVSTKRTPSVAKRDWSLAEGICSMLTPGWLRAHDDLHIVITTYNRPCCRSTLIHMFPVNKVSNCGCTEFGCRNWKEY